MEGMIKVIQIRLYLDLNLLAGAPHKQGFSPGNWIQRFYVKGISVSTSKGLETGKRKKPIPATLASRLLLQVTETHSCCGPLGNIAEHAPVNLTERWAEAGVFILQFSFMNTMSSNSLPFALLEDRKPYVGESQVLVVGHHWLCMSSLQEWGSDIVCHTPVRKNISQTYLGYGVPVIRNSLPLKEQPILPFWF